MDNLLQKLINDIDIVKTNLETNTKTGDYILLDILEYLTADFDQKQPKQEIKQAKITKKLGDLTLKDICMNDKVFMAINDLAEKDNLVLGFIHSLFQIDKPKYFELDIEV